MMIRKPLSSVARSTSSSEADAAGNAHDSTAAAVTAATETLRRANMLWRAPFRQKTTPGVPGVDSSSCSDSIYLLDEGRLDDVSLLFGENRVGEVALARIATDRNDRLTRKLRPARNLQGGEDVGPGRNPDQHPFLTRGAARHRDRVFVRYAIDFVVDLRVQNRRDEPGAGTLNLVRAGFTAREYGRCVRLDRYDVEARLALLDHLADARDGAAGSDRCNERVDVPVRVAPDLFGRRAAVDLRIGRVVELLRHEVFCRIRVVDFLRAPDRSGHSLGARCQHELRAV